MVAYSSGELRTANVKRFKEFGVATGVGDISCAIDTTIKTACVAMVGTLEQQEYVIKTAMDFYIKADAGLTSCAKVETCMAKWWLDFMKVGASMKTDAVIEMTTDKRAAWATARNTAISAALLALMGPKAGSAGASCLAVKTKTTAAGTKGGGAVATGNKGVRPTATDATKLCCMSCKKTATDTTAKEVFGVKADLKCTVEKAAATATVVNFYATVTKRTTEEWTGTCIEGALTMVYSTGALLATSYMMA